MMNHARWTNKEETFTTMIHYILPIMSLLCGFIFIPDCKNIKEAKKKLYKRYNK